MDKPNTDLTWSDAIFDNRRVELRLHITQPSSTLLPQSDATGPQEVRGAVIATSLESYLSPALAHELGLTSTDHACKFADARVWFSNAFSAYQHGGYSTYFLEHRFVLGQPETGVDVIIGDDILKLGTYVERDGRRKLTLPVVPFGTPRPPAP